MLGAIRQKKNSLFLLIPLGLALLAMLFFGISTQGFGQSPRYAARVNGESISEAEFASEYAQAYRFRQSQDPSYDRARAKADNLKKEVLDRLVFRAITAQEARRYGIVLDDAHLARSITSIPSFQEGGRFDRRRYERFLNQMALPDFRFEALYRQQLLEQSMLSVVEGSIAVPSAVFVSEDELRARYFRDRNQVDLAYILVEAERFLPETAVPTPEQISAWLAAEDRTEALKKRYEKDKSRLYDVPEKACASHILIRFERDNPEQKALASKKIAEAQAALAQGRTFQETALQFSEDTNKTRGGDLGCFARGDTFPAIAEAAFALEPGQTSPLVESSFGLHLITLREKKAPIGKSLDVVRDEVASNILRTNSAQALAQKYAAALSASARAAGALASAVEKPPQAPPTGMQLEVRETGRFRTASSFVPGLGEAASIKPQLAELTPEHPIGPEPVEVPQGFAVIGLKDRHVATDAEFAAEKDSLRMQVVMTKGSELFQAWREQLERRARVDINPAVTAYGES
jgi:peptidyl-prolyl cis-trans isomerase D